MIFNIISFILVVLTLWSAIGDFKKDRSLVVLTYFKRPIDWLISFALVIFVFFSVGTLSQLGLPKFFTWSWTSLLSQKPVNVITSPLSSGSVFIIIGFWLILSFFLPYLAKAEEVTFREGIFETKRRIKTNIIFGLVHMVMGVPLYVVLVLSVVGYVYSIFWKRTYDKEIKSIGSVILAEKFATEAATSKSTSIHAKYNFILITIVALISALQILMKAN